MFEQDRFIVRLRQKLNGDPSIVAAWLGGSHGRNQPDPFSDLDIVMLFADDEARERAWARRVDFCQNVMAYVAAKSRDEGDRHITLYANGTLAEFAFLSRATLQPHPDDADIKILKDSADNLAANHQQDSAMLQPPRARVSAAELQTLDDAFWIQFWDVYRVVRRGDSEKPFVGYVKLLADTLPTLTGWLLPNSAERRQLINLHYTRDAATTRAHLLTLLDAYRAARAAVIKQHQLDFRIDSAFEREIDRVMKK